MYDSENISLVTRIEAGTGVVVTYRSNSDGEGVYVASVDSDYLVSLVTVNAGGTLTLNATDEARIAALEARIGIETTPAPAPTPAPTGTAGTTEVNVTINGSETGTTDSSVVTRFTYSLVAQDGTVLISENSTASGGAAANIIELAIYSQMRRNGGMTKRVTPSYADGKLVLTWQPDQVGSTFKVDITSKHADDNIVFNITDY